MTLHRGQAGRAPAPAPLPRQQGPVWQAHPAQQRGDLRQHHLDLSTTAPRRSPPSAPRRAKGTKVFALGGKITNTGLVEIPMGTTLRTIVEEIGGGVPNGKKFKAAQTGGPSGGCIPASLIDTPIDYDISQRHRLHDGLRRPDRHGRGQLHGGHRQVLPGVHRGRVLRQVLPLPHRHQAAAGAADQDHRGQRRAWRTWTPSRSCATTSSSPPCAAWARPPPTRCSPPCSYFRDEYEAHVIGEALPRRACARRSSSTEMDPNKCKGCTRCARGCPTGAISGAVRAPHIIDQSKCIKCGACMEQLPL